MFAKTKTFSPMRTAEIGIILFVLDIPIYVIPLLFYKSFGTSFVAYAILVSFIIMMVAIGLITFDARHCAEEWEVRRIEARWAKKKRIMTEKKRWEKEKKLRHMEAEHLQKQNGKAKH